MRILILIGFWILIAAPLQAQNAVVKGSITSKGVPVEFANVNLEKTTLGSTADAAGKFEIKNIPPGNYRLRVSFIGYKTFTMPIVLAENQTETVQVQLEETATSLDEIVVTGTMKEVRKIESPVPVEVYAPSFFRKNPTPNLFDGLQIVNGVRPQLNCNVCNTGDIHINGLEGPYTMILIDGMPIVSGLSTVYGLSGIPNSLVDRIEIVKGPASSLYGSEAIGGLINVITKNPVNAPRVSADVFATGWGEVNVDLGLKINAGRKATSLLGINYFNYSNPIDKNHDNFTDLTLQERITFFNKWSFERKENRQFMIGARYFYEDRWGGDMRWTPAFRGGDSLYGESIYTKRWELLGNYQLPVSEKMFLSVSLNSHDQNSYYGFTPYMAKQNIFFNQLTWDKKLGKRHDLLLGTALRYTFYDDNTVATASADTVNIKNQPQKTWLPGIFIQDEITLTPKQKLLLGFRFDHHQKHGNIYTPRLAYKWSPNEKNIFRVNAGTGFRVVNLFTEDHAALTGARYVEVKEALKPEQSYNVNLNYIHKVFLRRGFIGLDAAIWYTYFENRILADYDSDPNRIIYDNLRGHAVSQGISLNADAAFDSGLKILVGATLMDVFTVEKNAQGEEFRQNQILTERWTGTWSVSYTLPKLNITVDYTGNIYGPMRLPLLGDLDPRNAYSPTWSVQNIQLTKPIGKAWEIYAGVKNILDWTPDKGNPFLIARTEDPFDKNVQFDTEGHAIPTSNNPYGLTFDPTYVFAPNQGIRFFTGVRFTLQN